MKYRQYYVLTLFGAVIGRWGKKGCDEMEWNAFDVCVEKVNSCFNTNNAIENIKLHITLKSNACNGVRKLLFLCGLNKACFFYGVA